ncbi:MAG TPA: mercury(II) reductase [Acidimicrobiales bacterium]|nr:mercury(II) reductase [Acidimicrobiales bacterium]
MSNISSRWIADVSGMTCDLCAGHVTVAVQQAGGANVAVSWRDGTVSFTADDLDQDAVHGAVADAGYQLRTLRRMGAPAGTGGDVEWDLAIIGSGSAAFAAAIRATEAGARVVMIERDTPGGTCVNVGCVPSKALIAAADRYRHARTHGYAGIPRLHDPAPDLASLVAQKDELVASLRQAKYLDLIDTYGFELRRGRARFVDAESITVDGEPLRASHYLIATGAAPALPPIDGLTGIDYLTSTTALELTQLPQRLAVIGANAIGLELGQAFLHLGSEVTFVDIADRIAPFEEPEISYALTDVLAGEGARVLTGAHITGVQQAADGIVAVKGDMGKASFDRVLVATGRAPNTLALNLDAAGVEVDRRGFVIVDQHLRTTHARVWAAGDVTASPQFVYVAAAQGALVADNAIGGAGRRLDYTTLPRVTFTTPQVAAVGLTDAEAAAAGHDVVTSVLPLAHVPRAIVNRDTRGLIKLVADGATDRLLGVHVLADGAGEVIQAGVYALMAGLTVAQVADAFHPYLTMAEGLKLAAQTFTRDVARLSCCAA